MQGDRVDTPAPDAPRLLFAYGTLKPGSLEAATAGGWSGDAVRGRMFDFGPHPALVDLGDPSSGWVEGFVRPVGEAELRDSLDPYEGVSEGLFRREATTTRAGRPAWVYVYARAMPRDARGPITRWDGPRATLGPGTARENDDGLTDRPDAAR